MADVFITRTARRDLDALEKSVAQRILRKLDFFRQQTNPLRFAKGITDSQLGTYRFRIGDYRVLFDIDHRGNILLLLILAVKHRRDVYAL